ncbi:MAG: hypothetical protein CSB13_01740 [Chloroflexi bacterium]|nr:MAG: hypothetical protein CSB13_01740 [Chloroflexota bacterium]
MSKELTINGYKLEVTAIAPLAPKALELGYKRRHPEPKPPTYTVEAVAGVTETFPHTSETIQGESQEVRAAFLRWKEAHDAWTAELTQKTLRLFISEGIKAKLTKAQEKNLNARAKVLGEEVPEGEAERNVFYLEMFIVDSPATMETLMKEVLSETGIDDEALAVASETFRD